MVVGRLLRENWIWLLALALGFFLRVDQLGSQILGDDEWHSLTYLQDHGYADIASHFGASDFCIPLSLLHRFLYQTIGLSEFAVRLLPLATGLVALVALPLLVRPLIGSLAAQLFALFLALFPLHVYFSRTARPYSVSILLALISLFAFERWLNGSGRRHAVLYVGCAALAPWFHLTVLPFAFAPVGWEVTRRIWSPGRASGPRLWTVVAVGATAMAAAFVLLAPPLLVDWRSVASKVGSAKYSWDTWREACGLLSGTPRTLAIAAWFLVSASGFVILVRRQPNFGWICVVTSLTQILAVLLVRPWIGGYGIVFVRYVLPIAPMLILGVAVALGAWIRSRDTHPRAREFACIAIALVWAATGALPAIHFRPNSWTNHGVYQFDYDMQNSYMAQAFGPVAIPSFYRTLAAMKPGEVVIAEAPFHFEWHKNNFYAYQRIHRQDTIVGEVNGLTSHDSPFFPSTDGKARFRNAIPIRDIPRLRARGVRFVVLHLHVDRELPDWDPNDPPTNMDPVVRFFTQRCSAPYMRDEQLVVFDLNQCHA